MHLSIPLYYLVLVMNGNSQLVESLSYEESVVLMCMCMVLHAEKGWGDPLLSAMVSHVENY